jgi:hypothetical protein
VVPSRTSQRSPQATSTVRDPQHAAALVQREPGSNPRTLPTPQRRPQLQERYLPSPLLREALPLQRHPTIMLCLWFSRSLAPIPFLVQIHPGLASMVAASPRSRVARGGSSRGRCRDRLRVSRRRLRQRDYAPLTALPTPTARKISPKRNRPTAIKPCQRASRLYFFSSCSSER